MRSRLAMATSMGKLHPIECGYVADNGQTRHATSPLYFIAHRHHCRRNTGAAINVRTIISATKPIMLPL